MVWFWDSLSLCRCFAFNSDFLFSWATWRQDFHCRKRTNILNSSRWGFSTLDRELWYDMMSAWNVWNVKLTLMIAAKGCFASGCPFSRPPVPGIESWNDHVSIPVSKTNLGGELLINRQDSGTNDLSFLLCCASRYKNTACRSIQFPTIRYQTIVSTSRVEPTPLPEQSLSSLCATILFGYGLVCTLKRQVISIIFGSYRIVRSTWKARCGFWGIINP